MAFANTEKKSKVEFKKAQFIHLPVGQNVIRIMENTASEAEVHYIPSAKASIICLGADCPICQTNWKIIKENPKSFRTVSNYHPKTKRFAVNVLDKTPAKICPSCGAEIKAINGTFPIQCECGQAVINVPVQPLNKVKILSKGVSLFDQFNELEKTQTNEQGEPIPLQHYDIILSVKGTGMETKITALPRMITIGEQTLPEGEELYDLKTSNGILLKVEEIYSLLKGVSLKDIFNARKANETPDTEEEEEKVEELSAEVRKLFND